ncbi:lytic murein transglycosylase [Micromonospora vulcania]|uniref:Lytic murein transglycosylase n=1 Tax=Micromonospora vulcania TaxID=1441873 RepID=A0ABW1GZJ9_9ACTN
MPRAVPRPRRPWLSGGAPDKPTPPAETVATAPAQAPKSEAPTADQVEAKPATDPGVSSPAAEPTAESRAAGPGTDAPDDDPKADTGRTGDTTTDTVPVTDPKADTSAGVTKTDAAPADDTKPATVPAGDPKTDTVPAGDTKADTVPADDTKTDTVPAEEPKTETSASAAAGLAATKVDVAASAPTGDPGRRRRVPFAHAVRLPPPRQAAATAARATRAWARRPSGRLTLPGVFLLALVAASAAAGAVLVPSTIRAPRPVAIDASAAPTTAVPPAVPSGLPGGAPLPTSPFPTSPPLTSTFPPAGGSTGGPIGPPVGVGRPSDVLAGWAQQVGAKVGIPPAAMQAYGYAELVLGQTNRSCALSWTTLAAIGQVESGHGSANGARLGLDGKVLPEIIGLRLDGNGGRMRIIDTDRGALDKDTEFDRAIGPMQFIPTTWQEIGADADNDGRKDPHDLDDAALAAGNYLCKNGRNLSIPGDWWNAILSYNDVRRYAQDVYDNANRYGQASRT